ncbi:hypothetical protein ABUE34_02955 [Kozakia baliensis]|uniref:hypothetical protein n=1 Tax=Kozakia baliensis TaxID=153496 RepID=UPI00345BE375
MTDDGISAAREDVLAELLCLKGERRAFRIGTSLFNPVDRPGWFAVDPEFRKGFLPAGSADVVDNGQHNPNSRLTRGFAGTRFTYLHWHNYPYVEMCDRARQS